jgi:nicotinate-nucleotide adenylyltransferase
VRGQGERIGILGGTFDPPHIGHLAAAVNVRHGLELDRVLVIPACIPWQKVGSRPITTPADRLAMVRAAFDAVPAIEVCTIELDRGGESFTVDTLDALHAGWPGRQWFVIVGSDVAPTMGTWRRADELVGLAEVVVYERPGAIGGRPPEGWPHRVVDVPLLDVSSTDIRARVEDGRPIEGLVTAGTLDVIRGHGLYGATA